MKEPLTDISYLFRKTLEKENAELEQSLRNLQELDERLMQETRTEERPTEMPPTEPYGGV
jgi:hypothetical protein